MSELDGAAPPAPEWVERVQSAAADAWQVNEYLERMKPTDDWGFFPAFQVKSPLAQQVRTLADFALCGPPQAGQPGGGSEKGKATNG